MKRKKLLLFVIAMMLSLQYSWANNYSTVASTNLTASGAYTIDKVIDGDLSTLFISSGLQLNNDFVTLDLGAVKPLSFIKIYFLSSEYFPYTAKFSISNDNIAWTDLKSFNSADISPDYPCGYIFNADGYSAQYVRMIIVSANVHELHKISEFQLEIPAPKRVITVESNNTAWGTVTGGGEKTGPIRCTATASSGYGFINWSDKAGNTISHSSVYEDNKIGDKTLVANFGKTHAVSVTTNPIEGGIVTISAPVAEEGKSVNLTVAERVGYRFVNWTVDGLEVSKDVAFTSEPINKATTFVANFTSFANYSVIPTTNISESGGNGITKMTDNSFSTFFWGGERQSVGKYVMVDLSAIKDLSYIKLYFTSSDQPSKAELLISNDNSSWTSLGTFDQGNIDPEFPYDYSYNATGKSARYVKMAIAENSLSWLQISEFRLEIPATQRTITLKANPPAGGIVTGGGTSAGEIKCNATANSGYEFVKWTNEEDGTVVSILPTFVDKTSGSKTYIANFVKIYTVSATANPAEGGNTVISATKVEEGETVNLFAKANAGYTFVNWTQNGTEVSTDVDFKSDPIFVTTTFVANFAKAYTVTATANPVAGGTVVPSATEVAEGKTTTLTATAKVGYVFVNWTKNGTEVSTDTEFTSEPIFVATAYVANFAKAYTVTATAAPVEGGSAASSAPEVEDGKTVTLTAIANNGYKFVKWTTSGKEASRDLVFTTGAITSDTAFVANFAKLHAVLAISNPAEGGSATPSYPEVVDNETVTLTATANPGYYFVNWTVDGIEVSKEAIFTSAAITKATTFVANFGAKEDIDIDINRPESEDKSYSKVTIGKGADSEPIWSIGDHKISADELDIKIEADGSTPQIDLVGEGMLSVDQAYIKRKVSVAQWALMSIPFDINLSEVTVDGKPAVYEDNIKIQVYDAAYRAAKSREGWTVSGWKDKTSGSITKNVGFAVAVNEKYGKNQVITFKSPANMEFKGDDKTIGLARHHSTVNKGADADWNLSGDPQLFSVDKGDGYTLYLYKPEDNSYNEVASPESATYLPFRGWFVQSADDFLSMTFRRNTPTSKSASSENVLEKQIFTINGNEDEARVILLDGSSKDYVKNEDAMYFAPLNQTLSQLYFIDHNEMKIAASVVPTVYKEVKLAYKAGKAGVQTITLSKIPDNTVVYLTDNQLSKTVQLKEGESYTFNSTAGINESRFAVKTIINPTGVDQAASGSSNIRVTIIGDDLKITGAAAGEQVTISTTGGVSQGMGITNEGITTVSTSHKGVVILTVGNEVVKVVK